MLTLTRTQQNNNGGISFLKQLKNKGGQIIVLSHVLKNIYCKLEVLLCDFLLCTIGSIETFPCLLLYKTLFLVLFYFVSFTPFSELLI